MSLLLGPGFPALLLSCSLKTTLLLGCAWIVTIVAHRQSAAFRHRLWVAGVLGSLAMPACTVLLPSWHWCMLGKASELLGPGHHAVDNSAVPSFQATVVDATASSPFLNGVIPWVLLVWLGGSMFFAIRLIGGLARLAWLSERAQPLIEPGWMHTALEICGRFHIARPVRVLFCRTQVTVPLTWGAFQPLILLPPEAPKWPEVRRRIVISHELAHVARGDWLLQICGELVRGLYWFHPLAWVAERHLRLESECACDDYVLNLGVAASEYASQLLEFARGLKGPSRTCSAALAFARPSALERRLASMLNPSTNRRHLSRGQQLVLFLAALCVLVPLAALRLPAQNASGKLTGTIHDPSGAPVSNATVIISAQKTDRFEMAVSDAQGNFSFTALAAGKYKMRVLKPGFDEYRVTQIAVEPGRDASEQVTLQLGMITEGVEVIAKGSAKAALSATPEKPTRVRLSGEVQAPKLLNKVQPVYPALARANRVEGTVLLHAVIGMSGSPLSLRVMNALVDPELARAAVEAVSQWRYSPTLLNEKPVEVDTTIMVNFKLVP